VLKTKVKLIEYAFETLPAWTLSMPPSKARKYNHTINNVSGKFKGVPQLTESTLSRQKCIAAVSRILPPRFTFLVFKKVHHRELQEL